MQDEDRKAVARLSSESVNTRNVALLDGHPGFWETRQIFPHLFQTFSDLQDTVEQQTCEGEWVTTRTSFRATHREPFMGVPASGKTINIMTISLDRIVDGKVVEHFGVADWVSALITMGFIPPPPGEPKK